LRAVSSFHALRTYEVCQYTWLETVIVTENVFSKHIHSWSYVTCMGYVNIFSMRATGFHRHANLFEVNFFIRKSFPRCSNPAGTIKIILTAGQCAHFLALLKPLVTWQAVGYLVYFWQPVLSLWEKIPEWAFEKFECSLTDDLIPLYKDEYSVVGKYR